jgi:uncharacterized protein GlcG (DUF336 family)
MIKFVAIAALGAVLLSSSAADAQQAPTPAGSGSNPLDVVPDKMPFDVPYGAPIALERAMVAINAAIAEAKKHDWKLNIAVVDNGGNLVAFQRMDGAQLASIPISEHKARAAVTFRRETKVWENAIQTNGFNYVLTLDGVIASRGGIPLIEGARIVGGIGCSGGTGSQDEVACKAGVAALQK